MMSRAPKVFICHMKEDAGTAERLFEHLTKAGADPWLDKRKLVLGDDWEAEIKKAVKEADTFVACLRPGFDDVGFRQREVRWAHEALERRPPGRGFIVPFVIDPCALPEWCKRFHAGADLSRPTPFAELLRAIEKHCDWRASPSGSDPHATWDNLENAPTVRGGRKISATADRIARLLVSRSKTGASCDPMIPWDRLLETTGLSADEALMALDELEELDLVVLHKSANAQHGAHRVSPGAELFITFDDDVERDALLLAREVVSAPGRSLAIREAAKRLSWEPRQLNPAVQFLKKNGLADVSEATMGQYEAAWVRATARTLRFASGGAPRDENARTKVLTTWAEKAQKGECFEVQGSDVNGLKGVLGAEELTAGAESDDGCAVYRMGDEFIVVGRWQGKLMAVRSTIDELS